MIFLLKKKQRVRLGLETMNAKTKSSSLFIEDLRDVENLAVTSTCLALKF